jgi:O-antigen/teichoic acid export membrane protein
MSRVKSAFLGSISSHVFMIMNMLISILVTPVILKYLNKEEYGFYVILFQIIGYLSMLDFGLAGAITRSLASNRGEDQESKLAINKIISTSFFTYSFFGAIVIILGFCFAPFMPRYFQMESELAAIAIPITLTLSIFVGLQFPLKVFSSIFYAHQRQLLSNTIGFSITLLNTLLPVLLLYLGLGLWSFVYTNIACSLIYVVATFIFMRKYYPFLRISRRFFNKVLLKQLFHFGFFLFLNSIAVQVVFFTDRFFIGALVSLSSVAIYSITAKAPELAREFIFRVTDNAYPAIVEINHKEGEDRLKIIHQKLLLITVCCSGIAFWYIYIANKWFIQLWVGENFYAGTTFMLLTLLLMLQHTILHVSASCLQSAGVVKGFSVVSIIEATINIILTITLGKLFGIKGILLATLIAGGLTSVWYVPYTALRHMKISLSEYLLKPLIFPLAAISGLSLILNWLCGIVSGFITINWFYFILISFCLVSILGIFVWIVFLKREIAIYIPPRFRKYLYA